MKMRAIAIGSLAASVALHGAGFAFAPGPEGAQIAASPGAIAALGNGFADLAAGSISQEVVEDHAQTPDPERTETTPPDATQEPPPETAEAPPPDATPETTPEPVTEVEPLTVATDLPPPETAPTEVQPTEVVPLPVIAATAPEIAAPIPVTAAEVPVTEPVPLEAMPTPALTPEMEIIAAVDPTNAVTEAPRPPARPERREPAPQPAPRQQPRQQPQQQQQRPAPAPAPTQAGNSDQDLQRGTETGSTGQAASTGQTQNATAQAGNAAVSNYPGQVMQRLQRQRRQNFRINATAVISFSVNASGGLASVGIARSSGHAEIDQAGVNLVSRAAPFPAPPAGAQTTFQFSFGGG